MPGMLETVLDVGMNDETVEALIRQTGNPRLAWDCYRRFIQCYATVVEGLPEALFDAELRAALAAAGVADEHALDFRALRALTRALLGRFEALSGQVFPQDPVEQLFRAASAVFRSWDAAKAVAYRRLSGLDDSGGTAVLVQVMVFGNAGARSGAGVAFTRDPATGVGGLYLDFQFKGQGEDVVAGRHTLPDAARLRARMPEIWAALEAGAHALEALFRDAQDFEFTVQGGALFLLQARAAKRTPWAALRIAVDLVEEGIVTPAEALARLEGVDVDTLVRTRFVPSSQPPVGVAQVAGIGVVSGAIALDTAAIPALRRKGVGVVLVRPDIATGDIDGIAGADGILTGLGGRTSHAAVVARQLGKVCLVGCAGLTIDLARRCCRIGGQVLQEGDFLSLDGNEGTIHAGRLPVVTERPERECAAVARWRADAERRA